LGNLHVCILSPRSGEGARRGAFPQYRREPPQSPEIVAVLGYGD